MAFDFGAGSAAYKIGWTDETTPLFSTIRANTIAALVLAGFKMAAAMAKRFVKRHPKLQALAFMLRRAVRARRPARQTAVRL